MFYTKYRPQTFSEVSKPNATAEALAQQIKAGTTAHAYLFIGSRGTGKTTTARILAKSLNCENITPKGDPCTKCNFCTQIQQSNFIDLIEIDAASNRGIDDIRSLREKVKLMPVNGKTKVYIIDEVHMLTNEAFNALLKTLEEPPVHVVFILCTTEDHKVPDTIKSRCQVFKFKRATIAQIIERLEGICEKEKIQVFETQNEYEKSKSVRKVSKKQLEQIAKSAKGGFRDAETLLEQTVDSGFSYTHSDSIDTLDFTQLVFSFSQTQALEALEELYSSGTDIYSFTGELILLCKDILLSKNGVKLEDSSQKLDEVAGLVSNEQLVSFITLLLDSQPKIKSSGIPQLPLELAIVQFCSLSLPNDKNISKPKNSPPEDTDDSFDTKITLTRETIIVEDAQEEDDIEKGESETATGLLVLATVTEKWQDIVNSVAQLNNSISAILKSSKPIKIDGTYLVLEVMYKFHKERLENAKNKELIEQVLLLHIDEVKSIKCVLTENKPPTKSKFESGDLTDLNVSPVSYPSVNKDDITGFFDGGLPMA